MPEKRRYWASGISSIKPEGIRLQDGQLFFNRDAAGIAAPAWRVLDLCLEVVEG